MDKRITIEFAKPDELVGYEKDAYSWVQCLEKARTGKTFFTAVKHGLKKLLESMINVQVVRRSEIGCSRFATEYHHQSYNSPWCHGRAVADYVISRGLQPHHNLLDLGCGCIRAGIWLIGYLDDGRYFGMDAHWQSLQAAVEYEIPLHNLECKHPRFLYTRTFDTGYFQKSFDVILANSVLQHLTEPQIDLALCNLAPTLAPSGRLILSPRLPLNETILQTKYGLKLIHAETKPCKFCGRGTQWFELMLSVEN